MLKLENTEVVGWEHAIRGMRNPKNSWGKIDSKFTEHTLEEWPHNTVKTLDDIGPNDHKLMMNLADGGPVHAKYRRMIVVYVDITAPLYWWKEFDTYKVGTVANSCSTMHKIHAKEFTLDDFSFEKVDPWYREQLVGLVRSLNQERDHYNNSGISEKQRRQAWYTMIQMLPSSYNQKRTVMLNYEVLANIYQHRRNHKLDEWHTFCDWIEELPYSELIIGAKDD